MRIFEHRDDEPAPGRTEPDDLAFFEGHPDREFRARGPFPHEIEEASRRGHNVTLAPDQSWIVIVTKCGGNLITTILAKCRLSPPGVYPDNDDDIRRAFKSPVPVSQPAGVPA